MRCNNTADHYYAGSTMCFTRRFTLYHCFSGVSNRLWLHKERIRSKVCYVRQLSDSFCLILGITRLGVGKFSQPWPSASADNTYLDLVYSKFQCLCIIPSSVNQKENVQPFESTEMLIAVKPPPQWYTLLDRDTLASKNQGDSSFICPHRS